MDMRETLPCWFSRWRRLSGSIPSRQAVSNRMGPPFYNLREPKSANSYRCLKALSPRKELNPADTFKAVL